jgi:hypothetical protein
LQKIAEFGRDSRLFLIDSMGRRPKSQTAATQTSFSAARGGLSQRRGSAEASNPIAFSPPELIDPSEDQIFYLRLLARYLCSRKGIKTLTLADSAEIQGDQKQKENKTQAFINRYTRGAQVLADYRAFWRGVLKLYHEHKRHNLELFNDPVMRQAFALVFPHLGSSDPNDDSFIDGPLQKWFYIDPQRSRDVCRHYSGLWWIVRPSTTRARIETEAEFNVALLNIQPEDVSNTSLPIFKFYQPASGTSGGGGVTSQGRLLSFHSDQILLLGKRRGSQTLTQLSWKYAWDPDRRKRETVIRGAISTVNTAGALIQSYFHGCFIEGTDQLRGTEFDEGDAFLRGFLGIKTEAELAEIPTSANEVQQLRQLQTSFDTPPAGISALTRTSGQAPHRAAISPAGLERLRASPQFGPILTII